MPGQHNGRSRRVRRDPFQQPLDRLLWRARVHDLPYAADPRRTDQWKMVCPICKTPDWTLLVCERGYGGHVDLRCDSGCSPWAIHRRLAADPVDVRINEAFGIAEEYRLLAERALRLVDTLLRPGSEAVAA